MSRAPNVLNAAKISALGDGVSGPTRFRQWLRLLASSSENRTVEDRKTG
jgi:hypothetical protein